MILLIYQLDLIQFLTFENILNLSNTKLWLKIHEFKFIQIKSETELVQIKTVHKLELLTPEIMRLLGSTKEDVDKDKDRENMPIS